MEDFVRATAFCLPIPSLLRTSRTSSAFRDESFLDLDLDLVWVSLSVGSAPPMKDDAWSRVETEGGRASAGLDMLLRPSKASLRSVTPNPRVDRVRLCNEAFSMCIRAGDILRSGEIPSPRKVVS